MTRADFSDIPYATGWTAQVTATRTTPSTTKPPGAPKIDHVSGSATVTVNGSTESVTVTVVPVP